ncbi:DUF6196 family protein [[Actinomadura] parvosata]|uniref:DUF6196 family protein n=1 Tax=[Actinomadura] parvosata TaxID=1955412 RepID=UPI003AABDE04
MLRHRRSANGERQCGNRGTDGGPAPARDRSGRARRARRRVCGSNRARGGIYDYWGCPVGLRDDALAVIRELRAG